MQSSVGIPHVVGGAMVVDTVMSMVGVGLGDAVVEAVLPGGEAINAGGHAMEAGLDRTGEVGSKGDHALPGALRREIETVGRPSIPSDDTPSIPPPRRPNFGT